MSETDDSPARSTPDRILDAAENVVSTEGGARLTIDAVVTESGLSKGGVLYHFPNKTALLKGMMQRMIDVFAKDLDTIRARAETAGEPILPALIPAIIEHRYNKPDVSMAILAASAEQPDLLDPARAYVSEFIGRTVATCPDPTLGLIGFLALDGLLFSRILGLDYVTPEQETDIHQRLIGLMQEMYS
ncbi:TetR/AcrR family transcriptional regulator [Maricaulis sp. D1M11]|uniref:TetR/AcrR family transcriptional regulator n=1 Tax=Maricaulis sp. D1M11 TaxID=3076117 RepID=UPI0039B44864